MRTKDNDQSCSSELLTIFNTDVRKVNGRKLFFGSLITMVTTW